MSLSQLRAVSLALGVVLALGCGSTQRLEPTAPGPEVLAATPKDPGALAANAPERAPAPRERWAAPEPRYEKLADAVGLSVLRDPSAELVELGFAFDAGSRRDGEHPGLAWLVAAELCERLAGRVHRSGVRPRCSAAPEAIVLRLSALPGDAPELTRATLQAARTLTALDERSLRARLSRADDDRLEPRVLAERLALRHLMVLTFAPHPAAWRFATDVQEGPFGTRAFQSFVERHLRRGGLEIVAVGPIELEALRAAIDTRELAGRERALLPAPGEREERSARRKVVLIDRGRAADTSITCSRLAHGAIETVELAAQVAALRAERALAAKGITARLRARATDLGAFGVLVTLHTSTSTERAATLASALDESFELEAPPIAALAAEAHARATDARRETWRSAAAAADALLWATVRGGSLDAPLPDASDVVALGPSIEQALDDARRSDGLVAIDGDAAVLAAPAAAALGVLDLLDPRRGMHRLRSVGPGTRSAPEEASP